MAIRTSAYLDVWTWTVRTTFSEPTNTAPTPASTIECCRNQPIVAADASGLKRTASATATSHATHAAKTAGAQRLAARRPTLCHKR